MAEDVRTRLGGPSSEVARREDLRDHLPAIESERQVTDWGRSERVEGLLDRTVIDFLYHLWFRCEVEGIDNVPDEGGALIVSNHSGALPPDAAMIVKAVKEEHTRPRPVHLTIEHFFKGYPGFSMLLPWPHLGLLGMVGYLPAKFKIRFLPPVRTDDMGDDPWEDAALVQTVAHDVRATIQEELYDMIGKRRSVWFG